MKLLITGICGFVGSTLALSIRDVEPSISIVGIDNFARSGSWSNRDSLRARCIEVIHADLRQQATLKVCQPVSMSSMLLRTPA